MSAADEKKGGKVKLFYDKLGIDGTLFGWNEVKGSRLKLKKEKK